MMAPTGPPGETPPSGSRGSRTQTKSVCRLLEPPSGTPPPRPPCPGSRTKRTVCQRASLSPSPSPAPSPSVRGPSSPFEAGTSNVGTGDSGMPITYEQIQGDEAAAPMANSEVVNVDDLEEDEDHEQVQLTGKRKKRLTSPVCADETISAMAIAMNEKFEKYLKQSNIALAVAYFLDPRYKKKLIEYYMRKFYGHDYQVELDEFVSVIKKLYQFYASSPNATSKKKSNITGTSNGSYILMDNVDEDLENFLYSATKPGMVQSNELDKYMAEPLQKIAGEFDILAWWKNKREEYPILTQMVHLMAIQVSTVASESAFSVVGRVVDPYRNRLDPEIVEALICTKDWVAAARKDSKNVGSIVSDLEVEALSAAMVNKLKFEQEEIKEENEEATKELEDMGSDPDNMECGDEI